MTFTLLTVYKYIIWFSCKLLEVYSCVICRWKMTEYLDECYNYSTFVKLHNVKMG